MPSVNIAHSAGYGRRGPSDTSGGTVFAPEWAALLSGAGGRDYGVRDADSWKLTRGALDREIVISAGSGYGKGVLDTTETEARFQLPALSSGSVWHLIAVHRDWAARQSSFTNIPGSATAMIPTRETMPGLLDDQPIYLVRVQAGQSQVAEIRDLRVWGGDGGSLAVDELVLQYLNRIGTRIRIGGTEWVRVINALGSPAWEANSSAASRFVHPITSDSTVGPEFGAYVGLISGTITDAPAGIYLVTARASLYAQPGNNVVGRVYVEWGPSGSAAREEARWDLLNVGTYPSSPSVSAYVTHPGGDLRVAAGYRRDSGTYVVTGRDSGETVVTAVRLGPA